ncbi:MAG TPA: thioredoxin-dependent thiol peroxidase [Myxococcales bacterium]|nr:thioredoxin-dependent thiol peroxidase [Myxococcales bacterium]HAN30854.1 thioredoxin-dependent thiol peroxidase [Myxococcales bacterium]
MSLEVGHVAPHFTLPAGDGSEVSLADLKGQWLVIYFYPRDNTPGCTTEACDFRDNTARLSAASNAKVFGVSGDSIASHQRFSTKYELPFLLLSDEDHTMMTAWGAWGEKKNYGRTYMGVIRSTYIVDPTGHIAAAWPKVRVKGHVTAVLETLENLQAG